MTCDEVYRLKHGLYVITWKRGGGTSLAAVGSMGDGTRWVAPCNWILVPQNKSDIQNIWREIESVKLIKGVK